MAGILFISCDEDCICNPPKEHVPDYRLVFSYVYHSGTYYNYIINTKTHQVIDSIAYDHAPFNDMQFFDGGTRAVVSDFYGLYVEDFLTHDTIALDLESAGYSFSVSSDDRYVILQWDARIYALPGLNLVYEGGGGKWCVVDGPAQRAFISAAQNILHVVDFASTPPETTTVEMFNFGGLPIDVAYMSLSPDDQSLLVVGVNGPWVSTIIYDADSLYKKSEVKDASMAYVVWAPDNVTCYGTLSGKVVKFNIQTQLFEVVLDTGLIIQDYRYANHVQITPDGEFLYIQGYIDHVLNGPTLVYDLIHDGIVYRYDYPGGGANMLRLNPKDWSR